MDKEIEAWLQAAKAAFNPGLHQRSTDFGRCLVLWGAIGDPSPPANFEQHELAPEFEVDMMLFDHPESSPTILRRNVNAWKRRFQKLSTGNSSAMDIDDRSLPNVDYASLLDVAEDGDLSPQTIQEMVQGAEDESPARPPKRPFQEDSEGHGADSAGTKKTTGAPPVDPATQRDASFSKTWSDIEGSSDVQEVLAKVSELLEALCSAGEDYWPHFRPDDDLWKDTDPAVRAHVESLRLPEVPLRT
ncbi:hypothetical protein AURDEDRAFT_186240, partial [Auricularia subglabra TFB-10046 SS5]